jgi:hypothetical protein
MTGEAGAQKWSPAPDATFHQVLARLDGGGYAVVESDNPASVMEGLAKFTPFFEFHVVPVVGITEGVPVVNSAIDFWDSVGWRGLGAPDHESSPSGRGRLG